jgi:hypothetical protein
MDPIASLPQLDNSAVEEGPKQRSLTTSTGQASTVATEDERVFLQRSLKGLARTVIIQEPKHLF